MDSQTSRRRLVMPVALAVPAFAAGLAGGGRLRGGPTAAAAAQPETTPTGEDDEEASEEPFGQADAPAWSFIVQRFEDPYQGEITRPEDPRPRTRYIGYEVVISNASNQPLEFSTADIAVVDSEGVAYVGGSVIGSEPRLVSQNLPDGERTRGWVWVSVPEDVTIVEVRFTAPPPVFRIEVPAS